MNVCLLSLFLCIALFAPAVPGAYGESYKLTRDPFAQPEGTKKGKGEIKPGIDGTVKKKARRKIVREEAQSLTLYATLTGNNPMANVNGTMITPGDRIQGFTLVHVRQDEVVLTKKGVQVVLSLGRGKN
ncbi:MAG: hypothetical protein ACE5FU_05265 [Nitrospinota bacterium]